MNEQPETQWRVEIKVEDDPSGDMLAFSFRAFDSLMTREQFTDDLHLEINALVMKTFEELRLIHRRHAELLLSRAN